MLDIFPERCESLFSKHKNVSGFVFLSLSMRSNRLASSVRETAHPNCYPASLQQNIGIWESVWFWCFFRDSYRLFLNTALTLAYTFLLLPCIVAGQFGSQTAKSKTGLSKGCHANFTTSDRASRRHDRVQSKFTHSLSKHTLVGIKQSNYSLAFSIAKDYIPDPCCQGTEKETCWKTGKNQNQY